MGITDSVVYLKHEDINSGVAIRVYCSKVMVGYNCKSVAPPNANYGDVARVQSQNMDNTAYTVSNIQLGYNSSLTATQLKQFIVANYESTAPIYLSFKYGGNDWKDFGDTVTDIPVQINGTITVNVDSADSKDAYLPNFSLPLIEQYEA